MTRITKARTGTGDQGYSNLVSGLKIKKSNEICNLQNTIQLFNNELRGILYTGFLPDEHSEFFEYISSSFCNSFAASIYFNFENADFILPSERLDQIDALISSLRDAVGDTQEFVIIEKNLLGLERVMLYIRQVEHIFWKILDQNNYFFKESGNREAILINFGRFLNSLSDYFFLLIRLLSRDVKYWSTKI